MSGKGMNRRQFLEAGAATVAGAAAAGAGAGMIGPRDVRAAQTTVLDPETAKTLLRVCRHLFPHDSLSDAVYAKVVEALDRKARDDPEVARTLAQGVAALDGEERGSWLAASGEDQLTALRESEGTPFFAAVRTETVSTLYNDPAVWRRFGYEGPSFGFGGYIDRGFDDLDWIDDAGEVQP